MPDSVFLSYSYDYEKRKILMVTVQMDASEYDKGMVEIHLFTVADKVLWMAMTLTDFDRYL